MSEVLSSTLILVLLFSDIISFSPFEFSGEPFEVLFRKLREFVNMFWQVLLKDWLSLLDSVQVTIQPLEFVYSPTLVDRAIDFFSEPISLYTRHELVIFPDPSSTA